MLYIYIRGFSLTMAFAVTTTARFATINVSFHVWTILITGDSKCLSSSIPIYPVPKALHLSCVQSFARVSFLHKLYISEFQLTVNSTLASLTYGYQTKRSQLIPSI